MKTFQIKICNVFKDRGSIVAGFSQLYEQYVEQVYYFLRELCGDDRLAEELTRETFYQAFRHVDSFENRGSVFDWLCRVGEDAYLKKCKRASKHGRRAVCGDEAQILSGKVQKDFSLEKKPPEGEVNAVEREKRIRRGLRRIRRRWICSSIGAVVILLIFLGVMWAAGGGWR